MNKWVAEVAEFFESINNLTNIAMSKIMFVRISKGNDKVIYECYMYMKEMFKYSLNFLTSNMH